MKSAIAIELTKIRGAWNVRQLIGSIAIPFFTAALLLSACGPAMTRLPRDRADLEKLRSTEDEQVGVENRKILGRLLERTKTEYDRRAAAGQPPPVIDILIVSGGGDWGAFGAGFLKGWKKVPAQNPLAMPQFDAVTGVSTGTLIAPFAFLGDEKSIDEIVNLYRNPGTDWVKQRGILYFLPDNISFAEVPGLEREMREHITLEKLRRIAQAGADGRLLAVNTTDLDTGTSRVFDLVAEAQRAINSGEVDRIHNVMLASAGIPGAFPFRIIDDQLYVDGGGNRQYHLRRPDRGRRQPAGPMAESLPVSTDPQVSLLGDFQQSVSSGARGGGAELAGGHSTEPGNFHARRDSDGGAPSLRDGRDFAAQAQGRCRSPCRLDSR